MCSLTLRHIGHTRTNNGFFKLIEALQDKWFVTWGGGVKKFLGGREPLHALQHRKILNGNVPF